MRVEVRYDELLVSLDNIHVNMYNYT